MSVILFEENQSTTPRMKSFLQLGLALMIVAAAVLLLVWILADSGSGREGFPPIWWVPLIPEASFAIWLSFRIRTRVDEGHYRVQLWPWPKATEVPIQQIKAAHTREVRPGKEFGGWGYRIKPGARLYSLGGRYGVSVEYEHQGKSRELTVTTEQADELLAALSSVGVSERTTGS